MAMLVPSIDLMGGKIVQLIHGQKKALEFDDFEPWIARFSKYPLVQLIDLDAAMGTGSNATLVKEFVKRLPCQVGGGIRGIDDVERVLSDGARRVILGSALILAGEVNRRFARQIAHAVGGDRLVFAVDSREGRVAIQGWKQMTEITPMEMIDSLRGCCDAFLYTHIDTEGTMQGLPLETITALRDRTKRRLIVAGGIASREEVDTLDALQVDAVVGMAIYTERMRA
jgi:phosphoribosylformimino-5-aminoimidazole carboxamide ribotide isomerase